MLVFVVGQFIVLELVGGWDYVVEWIIYDLDGNVIDFFMVLVNMWFVIVVIVRVLLDMLGWLMVVDWLLVGFVIDNLCLVCLGDFGGLEFFFIIDLFEYVVFYVD